MTVKSVRNLIMLAVTPPAKRTEKPWEERADHDSEYANCFASTESKGVIRAGLICHFAVGTEPTTTKVGKTLVTWAPGCVGWPTNDIKAYRRWKSRERLPIGVFG
jgi:hypothetical protein